MLVLTRKQKEVIRIGDNVTITILRIKGQSVRVGIEAPHEVKVIRGELEEHVRDDDVANEPTSQTKRFDQVVTSSGPGTACRNRDHSTSNANSSNCEVSRLKRIDLAKGKSRSTDKEAGMSEPSDADNLSLNVAHPSTLAILARRRSGFSTN